MSDTDKILAWCERMEKNLLKGSTTMVNKQKKTLETCYRGEQYFCDGSVNRAAKKPTKGLEELGMCKYYIDNKCTYKKDK